MISLFKYHTERFFIFSGLIDDEFILSSLEIHDLQLTLFRQLKDLGYQRVLFFHTTDRLYFLDYQSASYQINSSRKTQGVPTRKRPLGQGTQVPSEVPQTARLVLERITDHDAIVLLDNFMKDKTIRTAIVFTNFEMLVSNLPLPRIHTQVEEWKKLPHDNYNISILLVPTSEPEKIFRNNPWFNIYKQFSKPESELQIGYPKRDEINLALLRFCIVHNCSSEWIEQLDVNIYNYFIEKKVTLKALLALLIDKDNSTILMNAIKNGSEMNNTDSINPILNMLTKAIKGVRPPSGLEMLSKLEGVDDLKNAVNEIINYHTDLIKSNQAEKSHYEEYPARLLQVNRVRENTRIGLNFIFSGNPGTGKTTAARILAKILTENGILNSGNLVEVGRDGLVGQYIGETAIKTRQRIADAIGGILFVDEAYSLAPSEDTQDNFASEAINVLVQDMENKRGELAFIFAGYTSEMEVFMNANPGIASRINYKIIFPDFTPRQLANIFTKMVSDQGYQLSDELNNDALLLCFFQNLYNSFPSTKKFGNAREVRKLVDNTIKKVDRSKRIIAMQHLIQVDSKYHDYFLSSEKLLERLNSQLNELIGLSAVKDRLKRLLDLAKISGSENEKKGPGHYAFVGNPGTGKTTIARLMGGYFQHLGLLRKGHVVEVSRADLVAGYVGQTAIKTQKKIEEALGGVLFIDEAYSLARGEDNNYDFGKEAIDTIIKAMEDYRHDISFVFAGYTEEMKKFIDVNPGMKSRISEGNIISFENYSYNEIFEILVKNANDDNYTFSEKAKTILLDALKEKIEAVGKDKDFGNGRYARNLYRLMKDNYALRVKHDNKVERIFTELDVPASLTECLSKKSRTLKEVLLELDRMIGLVEVKTRITSLSNVAKHNVRRGRRTNPGHYAFIGNPGTGKTTVARLLGEILKHLGLLRKGHVVEVSRADLVAGYVGQTAIKTQKKIEEALGGVLFIDEAYTLSREEANNSDFGKEAIDTIIKAMEDYRHDISFVFAGYTEEMKKFIDVNPGMKSRLKIKNIITFEDYKVNELILMLKIMIEDGGYIIADEAIEILERLLSGYLRENNDPQYGNARFVRNLYEDMEEKLSSRNIEIKNGSMPEFTKEDIPAYLMKSEISK